MAEHMRRDLYTEVTNKILAEMESGSLPWVRPWAATAGANTPCNAVSNRPYSGVNTILLWLARGNGWPTPRFVTYKQATENGGFVRKGEHGTRVIFVKQLRVIDKNRPEEDARIVPMMREYCVFNVAQTEGLSESIVNGRPMRARNPDTRDELADAFIAATGIKTVLGGEAFYTPSRDWISMPPFESFRGADYYYGTIFHELIHASGAKHRLDRDLSHRFGTEAYAAEELTAELGAAFLGAEFGFDGMSRHHAAYIKNWIALLKRDKRAFFTACSKAQAAVDFYRALVLKDDAPQSEEQAEELAA